MYFTIADGPLASSVPVPVITDNVGRANLRELSLPAGSYSVTAQFAGNIPAGRDANGTQLYRTLTDDVYQPASATFVLELQGNEACPVSDDGDRAEDKSERGKKGKKGKKSKKGKKGDHNGKLKLRGFCYLTHDIDAAINIVDGTLIATSNGEVPVEDLRISDLVQTMDRGFQPVR